MPLLKMILRILYNGIIGGISLILLNLAVGLLGFHIALNLATALLAGFLGLPGIVLIVLLQRMFG